MTQTLGSIVSQNEGSQIEKIYIDRITDIDRHISTNLKLESFVYIFGVLAYHSGQFTNQNVDIPRYHVLTTET